MPIKLLVEASGHPIGLQLTSGVSYKGKLIDAEDNMNLQLQDVTITQPDGQSRHSPHVYIRGSQIEFISLPEVLKSAPLFNPATSKPPAPVRTLAGRR